MDEIRKKIKKYGSESHFCGILPYIENNGNGSIKFVTIPNGNGNFGGFVCDFAVGEVLGGILYGGQIAPYIERDEFNIPHEYRIKYCEIIKRYNDIQSIVRNAIIAKCVNKKEFEYIEQEDSNDDCKCAQQLPGNELVLTTKIMDDDLDVLEKLAYDFEPLNLSDFTTDDYQYCYRKANSGVTIEKGHAYILIPDKEIIGDDGNLTNEPAISFIGEINDWWSEQISNFDNILSADTGWKSRAFINGLDGTDNLFRFCKDVEKNILGKVEIPEAYEGQLIQGNMVKKYVTFQNARDILAWFDDNDVEDRSEEAQEEWDKRGGDAMRAYLTSIKTIFDDAKYLKDGRKNGATITFVFLPPVIEIPIFFENEHSYEGIYESYIENAKEYLACTSGPCSALTPHFISGLDIKAESKLNYVRDENAYLLDEEIYGTWEKDGKVLKFTYHEGTDPKTTLSTAVRSTYKLDGNKYKWWEISTGASYQNYKYADGEVVNPGDTKYRSLTTYGEVWNIFSNNELETMQDGASYYFKVRYDNGKKTVGQNKNILTADSTRFDIPYRKYNRNDISTLHNMYVLTEDEAIEYLSDRGSAYTGNKKYIICDYIESIETGETITFKYVIGGLVSSGSSLSEYTNTGIHYEETYDYYPGKELSTNLNGRNDVTIYCNFIDFDSNKETIYNEEIGLYRDVIESKITAMEIATTWTKSLAMTAPLFTKSGIDSFKYDPREKFDIYFDRGAGAAFENHFKLAECNTMEDLVSNSNNIFNL